MIKYQDGEVENSFQLFQELLSLNPNDNQGVRALATEALYELGRFEDVIELTNHYRNDMMSETLYGRAIAFFKLGREREASVALNKAMKYLPLIGKELLKKRHRLPKTARPNRVTVGGADEAYYYWEHWGKFWIDDSEVFKWLRGHIGLIELGRTDRR